MKFFLSTLIILTSLQTNAIEKKPASSAVGKTPSPQGQYSFVLSEKNGPVRQLAVSFKVVENNLTASLVAKLKSGKKLDGEVQCIKANVTGEYDCDRQDGGGGFTFVIVPAGALDAKGESFEYKIRLKHLDLAEEGASENVAIESEDGEAFEVKGAKIK